MDLSPFSVFLNLQSRLFLLLAACLPGVALAVGTSAPAEWIAWEGATEIATGAGEKGPWRQNDSRYRYVDDPTVVIDARGNVAVAWVDQARKDVLFRRLSADGRQPPADAVNVSRSPGTFSWLPRMRLAPDRPDRIYVLWQEIIFSGGSHGGDILFARSDDNGAHFSPPLNLSRSLGGDGKGRITPEVWHNGSLDLATGPGDAVYAAWTEYDGQLWFSRSADGGKSFSAPQRIAGGHGDKPARAPALTQEGEQRLYLAWTTGGDDGADIHLARSDDGGRSFDAPLIVAPSDRYSDAPKLVVGPDGTLHLVYAQSERGPFDRFRIRYTRSRDGGRSFEASRDISHPLPGAANSAHFPSAGIDGAGRLYVLYELYPHHRRNPRGLGMTLSADGGNGFLPAREVPESADPAGGENGSHQGRLMQKLAVGSDGSIAIVNSSLKHGEQSRVWMLRGKMNAAQGSR